MCFLEKESGEKEVDSNREKEVDSFFIPSEILRDRTLSILESIIEYLKEVRKLSFVEISRVINRDERNVWTIYNRAKKKRGGAK